MDFGKSKTPNMNLCNIILNDGLSLVSSKFCPKYLISKDGLRLRPPTFLVFLVLLVVVVSVSVSSHSWKYSIFHITAKNRAHATLNRGKVPIKKKVQSLTEPILGKGHHSKKTRVLSLIGRKIVHYRTMTPTKKTAL